MKEIGLYIRDKFFPVRLVYATQIRVLAGDYPFLDLPFVPTFSKTQNSPFSLIHSRTLYYCFIFGFHLRPNEHQHDIISRHQ